MSKFVDTLCQLTFSSGKALRLKIATESKINRVIVTTIMTVPLLGYAFANVLTNFFVKNPTEGTLLKIWRGIMILPVMAAIGVTALTQKILMTNHM